MDRHIQCHMISWHGVQTLLHKLKTKLMPHIQKNCTSNLVQFCKWSGPTGKIKMADKETSTQNKTRSSSVCPLGEVEVGRTPKLWKIKIFLEIISTNLHSRIVFGKCRWSQWMRSGSPKHHQEVLSCRRNNWWSEKYDIGKYWTVTVKTWSVTLYS